MIAQPPSPTDLPPMPQFQSALAHYAILTAMLAPALLMAATASLLTSANARLARVVDRLRALMVSWEFDASDAGERQDQIHRHRRRAHLVLRACQLLYWALGAFVGTSLGLALDAFIGFKLGVIPTGMALLGVLFLLAASISMGREVSLSVSSFDLEMEQEMKRKRQ